LPTRTPCCIIESTSPILAIRFETGFSSYLLPTDVTALTGAASLYGLPENVVSLQEAIGWLEYATQLEPDDPNYHFRLGQLCFEAGRAAKAKKEWLRALTCPKPISLSQARTIESVLARNDEVDGQHVNLGCHNLEDEHEF
jgi:tetratricopeptide (TPR) repeat protein